MIEAAPGAPRAPDVMVRAALPPGVVAWTPTYKIEERLRELLVPTWLYFEYKLIKERWRGEPELRLLPFLVDRAKGAIDVGANKGVYAYALAKLCPVVHAFEPHPKAYGTLLRLAGDRIKTYPVAVSDRQGEAVLHVPRGEKGYSNQRATLAPPRSYTDYGDVAVEARRLDDYGFADIGFVKIDVEGCEAEVLRGAGGLIAACRPTLLIEIEEIHSGVPIEASLRAVAELGYRGFFLRRGAVTDLSRFDPEAHHRRAVRDDRPNYVFNFIFLPMDRAA